MRRWRNWYTRQLEVLVGATPWRFKSSSAHQEKTSQYRDVFSLQKNRMSNSIPAYLIGKRAET
jgi:hypothetical protein